MLLLIRKNCRQHSHTSTKVVLEIDQRLFPSTIRHSADILTGIRFPWSQLCTPRSQRLD